MKNSTVVNQNNIIWMCVYARVSTCAHACLKALTSSHRPHPHTFGLPLGVEESWVGVSQWSWLPWSMPWVKHEFIHSAYQSIQLHLKFKIIKQTTYTLYAYVTHIGILLYILTLHTHTVTTFKYVEGGPDREAPEVVFQFVYLNVVTVCLNELDSVCLL